MAQFFTDFSEYTVGSPPSDWSKWIKTFTLNIQESVGAVGGKVLRADTGSNGQNIFTWDEVPASADVEILYKATGTTSGGSFPSGAVRAPSLATDIIYYRIGGLQSNLAGVHKYIPAFTNIAQVSIAGTTPDWLWVRCRVNGTSLKVRMWKDGDPEPAAWDIDVTDSSLTAAGLVGFMVQKPVTEQLIDVFGVGTDGDTAPSSPVVVSTLTLTSITPTTGPSAGGTTVTMTGTGFEAGTVPKFNGVDATSVTVVSDTELTCVTPAL